VVQLPWLNKPQIKPKQHHTPNLLQRLRQLNKPNLNSLPKPLRRPNKRRLSSWLHSK
jgi:hypothetical protein